MSNFTKKEIIKTFVELLNEKPFDKITIKEITERCKINRNTFYYHFQDIYNVLEELLREETNKVINASNTNNSLEESINFVINNKIAFFHIYNSLNRKRLEYYFSLIFEALLKNYIKNNYTDYKLNSDDEQLLIKFYIGAFLYYVFDWFENKMEKNPTEILDKLINLFKSSFDSSIKSLI